MIVIHCSDTYDHMDIGVQEINRWHLDRGWSGIGYHFVIRRDGTLENGRGIDQMGAHVRGHNASSIGICLVGGRGADGMPEDNYEDVQMETLEELVESLLSDYPDCSVSGHNELDMMKACPSFDVQEWLDVVYGPEEDVTVSCQLAVTMRRDALLDLKAEGKLYANVNGAPGSHLAAAALRFIDADDNMVRAMARLTLGDDR